jgi:hypothetical protein
MEVALVNKIDPESVIRLGMIAAAIRMKTEPPCPPMKPATWQFAKTIK